MDLPINKCPAVGTAPTGGEVWLKAGEGAASLTATKAGDYNPNCEGHSQGQGDALRFRRQARVVSLREKLNQDLREALRGGESVRVSSIRMVLAAARNAEIAKGRELDDGGVLDVISREIRQRRESIVEFRKGRREDLASREEAELAVLEAYLPEQATHEEIVAAAQRIIAEVGARGPQDKGRVMPVMMAQFKGKADGREINTVVTELLAGKSAP
jgi:uncharacterized protein YqeY